MKRSKHTLSHYRLLTGDMGTLYPIGLVEVLPKDTFQHSASVFMRFAPMAAPVMHPITVRVHHFFMPHRLSWPQSEGGGWEEFITGGPDGDDSQTPPSKALTGTEFDLCDYMGLPLKAGILVNELPFRAFNAIFNEYYRDQDLVTARLEDDLTMPKIAWEKDYLTMARPWEQKGTAIQLPIGDSAPVVPDGADTTVRFGASDGSNFALQGNAAGPVTQWSATKNTDPVHFVTTGLEADLSSATAPNINEFRRAFALQRFAEARARYGSRYTEYLRYLGVRPSDARLQRPEYLGGGKVRVSMSEVLQTANEAASDRFGVGDLYGHGVAAMKSNAYRRTFEEHGYVVSLLSVRPKAMYTDGIPRHWLRQDRDDYWQKELEQIGQQAIWEGEAFVTASESPTVTYGTFGYQDRYREYREERSTVSGEFKDILDYWHLGRQLGSIPTLNASFVECSPSKRIFNVTDQHTLWIAVQHNLVARRLVARNASSRIM